MLPVLWNNSAMAPVAAGPINRLETLFDRVFGDDGAFLGREGSWVPVAMWEDDDHVYVEAELPGLTDKDVEVTFHNGMLFIRGERSRQEGRQYLYNGRTFGRFERVVTLPEAVDTDGAQAALTDGILSISLPKSPESRPKRIALRTG